jgi:ABC-type multidrug transport system fused ATPase/permease subunit
MRLRSAVATSVYLKSLVLSNDVFSRRSTGEISNLMSVDSTRLQDLTGYLHALWYSFYQIGWALFFLWQQLHVSSLTGIAIIIVFIPITNAITRYLKSLQKRISSIRDERVKLTNEIFQGIKIIKFQAWEKEYKDRLIEIRHRELAVYRQYAIVQSLSGALSTGVPLLIAIGSFATYIALGNKLDVATALTSLALFDLIRFPLFVLPNTINSLAEALVACDRINDFLLETEKQGLSAQLDLPYGIKMENTTCSWVNPSTATRVASKTAASSTASGSGSYYSYIKSSLRSFAGYCSGKSHHFLVRARTNIAGLKDGSISSFVSDSVAASSIDADSAIHTRYIHVLENRIEVLELELNSLKNAATTKQAPEPLLNVNKTLPLTRITLDCKPGDLVGVVGTIGSSKTSLLNALLGDLHQPFGSSSIKIKGKVAYCAQKPFILCATLRDNILFGLPYSQSTYKQVLRDCALEVDIQTMPDGDLTEIGEKGISISGGQKARIALARALYSNSDIYLLDDPLAAVDAHVSHHLFHEVIIQLKAKKKLVLLVTNAIQYLTAADRIVVLNDGSVVEEGVFADLAAAPDSIFNAMITTYNKDNESNKDAIMRAKSLPDEAQEGSGVDDSVTAVAVHEGDVDAVDEQEKSDPVRGSKLIQEEERQVGNVNIKYYTGWLTAAGSLNVVGISLLALFYVAEINGIFASWWLSYWSEDKLHRSPWFYLGVYVAINVFTSMFLLSRELYCRLVSWKAGKTLHDNLLNNLMHAPMVFFESTPLGRITNRFSKDIYTLDEQIPNTIRWYLQSMCKVTGVCAYVIIITPLFLLGLIPIAYFYLLCQRYYIKTSRELTRLDGISRSPIYALFSETLDGIATIRAFNRELFFTSSLFQLLDKNQQAYFLNFSANCWLGVRLEFAGNLIVSFAALSFVIYRSYYISGLESINSTSTFAGFAGLGLSLCLSITQSLNWSVRMASDLESQMVSVERVHEYTVIPSETEKYYQTDAVSEWPKSGGVTFKNVSMRYRPDLPFVLHDLSFDIKSGDKIGIVGRTGSGKSSTVTSLLRLVEISSGSILIDGVDISSLSLNTLRSKVAVIPQDPVLFSGTIRSNLDPFHYYTDEQLWYALKRCNLHHFIASLDDAVSENGSNFSTGQRQLICFTRALVSNAKVIVCDEATSACDVIIDDLIQKTVRSDTFAATTMITIAHRINTIIDSTKIMVLDSGRVVEFDTPATLLSDPESEFTKLVNQAAR